MPVGNLKMGVALQPQLGGFPEATVAEAVGEAPSNVGHCAAIVAQPAACQPDERLEVSPSQILGGVGVASVQISDPTRDRIVALGQYGYLRPPAQPSREDFTTDIHGEDTCG